MINEIEKYINKYTFLRYALLFYLISLAGQLILLREEGISIDNFKYYNLLDILNFTKEISIFLLVIVVFIFIDILLKFKILVDIEYNQIIAKLGALVTISLLLLKLELFRVFFVLNIKYCIQNFDIIILLFITIFTLESLSYVSTKNYEEFDFLCRMIVYSFVILKGISLFMS